MWFNGESVEWLKWVPGVGRDSYNRPIGGWESKGMIANAGVAPGSSNEPWTSEKPHTVKTDLAVYLASDPGISAGDRLVVRGKTYEVEGEPAVWRSPFTGWMAGVQVNLNRVEA